MKEWDEAFCGEGFKDERETRHTADYCPLAYEMNIRRVEDEGKGCWMLCNRRRKVLDITGENSRGEAMLAASCAAEGYRLGYEDGRRDLFMQVAEVLCYEDFDISTPKRVTGELNMARLRAYCDVAVMEGDGGD